MYFSKAILLLSSALASYSNAAELRAAKDQEGTRRLATSGIFKIAKKYSGEDQLYLTFDERGWATTTDKSYEAVTFRKVFLVDHDGELVVLDECAACTKDHYMVDDSPGNFVNEKWTKEGWRFLFREPPIYEDTVGRVGIHNENEARGSLAWVTNSRTGCLEFDTSLQGGVAKTLYGRDGGDEIWAPAEQDLEFGDFEICLLGPN